MAGAPIAERESAVEATGSLWFGVWTACVEGGSALTCWGTAGGIFAGPLTSGVQQRALPTRGVPALP